MIEKMLFYIYYEPHYSKNNIELQNFPQDVYVWSGFREKNINVV